MTATQLVDLIEHDDRVHYANILQCLYELARHGANVGAAMALDLGFIAHAANAEAIEGTVKALGDGASDAGLADTWWAHQQDN